MRPFKLTACPWCKALPTLEQDFDGGWQVACSTVRCPVAPISSGYKFQHMAVMAWNCCGQPGDLPTLLPVPERIAAQGETGDGG